MSQSTTRRAIVAGAAAAIPAAVRSPAVALPGEPDPIFAAIEEYRAALDATRDLAPDEDEEPEFLELQASVDAFVAATPTTVAGCAAMLRFLYELAELDDINQPFDDWTGSVHESGATLYKRLAETLERAAVQS